MGQNYNLPPEPTTTQRKHKRRWLVHHWGIFSAIGRQLGVSPQYVRAVFWGEGKRSKDVEYELRRRGAPMVRRNGDHKFNLTQKRRPINA